MVWVLQSVYFPGWSWSQIPSIELKFLKWGLCSARDLTHGPWTGPVRISLYPHLVYFLLQGSNRTPESSLRGHFSTWIEIGQIFFYPIGLSGYIFQKFGKMPKFLYKNLANQIRPYPVTDKNFGNLNFNRLNTMHLHVFPLEFCLALDSCKNYYCIINH